jgi:hypothetical protein
LDIDLGVQGKDSGRLFEPRINSFLLSMSLKFAHHVLKIVVGCVNNLGEVFVKMLDSIQVVLLLDEDGSSEFINRLLAVLEEKSNSFATFIKNVIVNHL